MQDAFFANLANRQRELRAHGFDTEPTEEELVDYAFGLDDKLAVLCESFAVRLVQDAHGRWTVIANDAKGEKWQSRWQRAPPRT